MSKTEPTEAQIVAAARVLNKRHATLCNVNEADSWAIQGDDFREDARAALRAALAQQPAASGEPNEAQVALLDPWMRPAAARELLRTVLAAATPHPAPARAPLTEDALVEGYCKARHSQHYVSVFIAGAKFAERHHGITAKEAP